jgi:hypothetical protein
VRLRERWQRTRRFFLVEAHSRAPLLPRDSGGEKKRGWSEQRDGAKKKHCIAVFFFAAARPNKIYLSNEIFKNQKRKTTT